MLNRLSSAANAAPTVASCAFWASSRALNGTPGRSISRPPNTSWIIGEAIPITPIPALTLRQRTAHSSQNCGVFQAVSTCTCRAVIIATCLACGFHPAGFQSGGGTR